MSKLLAASLELTQDKETTICAAAILHDLGKIAIPHKWLIKPQQDLSKKHLEDMRQHPANGYDALKNIRGFEEIALIIKHHHEGITGCGYPDGLMGNAIPIGSRVIAVADMYDRQMCVSGQLASGNREKAKNILLEASGKFLDARMVNIFLEQVIPPSEQASQWDVEMSFDALEPGMVLARDLVNYHGIPLLRAGTKFDEELIKRLGSQDGFSPVFTPIYVDRRTVPGLAEPETPAGSAPVESAIHEPEQEKLRVVVVDDQPSIVSALKRELRAGGYDVICFTEPADALLYIHKNRGLFAVITDYVMPGVMGDKLLAEVQKECPDMPCIVITGAATKENVMKMVQSAKVTRVLPKPWDRELLLATLESFKNI